MSLQVTETDLRHFAFAGFPASLRASTSVTAIELAESCVRALEKPSARLCEAVKWVLQHLASSSQLEAFLSTDLSDDVRRRLGFLAERCAQGAELESDVARRLASFAHQLREFNDSEKPPLTLMARTNPTLMRLQMERADEVNQRWNVLDS